MAKYTIDSDELNGACFYLVSGHGGPDPGAIGELRGHPLHEDEYAYDIMLRLARNLMSKGAKVHIIIQDAKDGIRNDKFLDVSDRETCMGQVIPLNQVKRLQQRCDKINELFKKDKEHYRRALLFTSTAGARVSKLTCFSIITTEVPRANIWQTRYKMFSTGNTTSTNLSGVFPAPCPHVTCS